MKWIKSMLDRWIHMNKKLRYGMTGLLICLLLGFLILIPSLRLSPVSGLSWEKVNAGTIRLSWDPVEDCDGYIIRRYNKGKETMDEVGRVRSASICVFDDDVNANRRQRYAVSAFRGEGKSQIRSGESEIRAGGLTGYETIGHRGAMDLAPDDTIASFERAKEVGYTTFECDLWTTTSGDLFIFHDPTLDHLTGKEGDPSKLSEDNYLMYPIINGKNADRYPAQYPPDLDEVLAWGRDHDMRIIIHMKVLNGHFDKAAYPKICRSVKKYGMRDKVLFFTSNYRVSEQMSHYPLRTGFLTPFVSKAMRRYAIETAARNGCELVIMRYQPQAPLTADINRLAHEKGLKTAVYNVSRTEEIRYLINSRTDHWILNRALIWKR